MAKAAATKPTRVRGPLVVTLRGAGAGGHDAQTIGDGGEIALRLQIPSGQTADALQIEKPDGTTLWKVDKDGNMTGGSVTATGSLSVPTGQTAVVTDADTLTVGGRIIPQQLEIAFSMETPLTTVVFIANAAYQVVAVRYRHRVLGTNGGAVTAQITKDPSATAPGAGTALLTNNANAGFDCKATINTNQVGTLSATVGNLQLAAGDALSIAFTGTLTALAGVAGTISLKRI